LDPDTGPMRIESLRRTYSLWSDGAARPKEFGSSLMPHPSNLGKTSLSSPKFLGSERGFLTKLIIIIIEFALQINSMFFYRNNIYFKFNNVNKYHNINNNIKLV